MKLKLLFFPFALVFSIILAIWYIKPEFLLVKDNKAKLQVMNQKKADLEKQMSNIERLSGDLEGNSKYKEIVMQYIPERIYVEQIIDNVNYLAGDMLGVSLINISLNKSNSSVGSTSTDDVEAAANKHGFTMDSSPEEMSVQAQNIQFNEVSLGITIIGEYEKIKSYLEQIRKMKHMNKIQLVSLSAVSDSSSGSGAGEEVIGETPAPEEKSLIQAEISVSFKYLPLSPAYGYYVLNNDKFDYSAVDRLTESFQGGIDIPEIRVSERGKVNPFE